MRKAITRVRPKELSVALHRAKKPSYEKDYVGWIFDQVGLLKNKEFGKLDIVHLTEEIESLGKSQRDKLESYLIILLMHMLKVKYQPDNHTKSWDLSIKHSKHRANKVLKDNPSLKHKLDETFKEAYYSARIEAAIETKLPEKTFPQKCPWELKDIL